MSLPHYKKMFLKNITYGLDAFSEQANKIGQNPQGTIEQFIKKNVLNVEHDGSYTFSKGKFMMSLAILDFDTLADMLIHLDTVGVTIEDVYFNARINILTLPKIEREYCRLINDKELTLFRDFILY
tara:strand:- start:493 stop:870 length:378 start_codon:yes stop_codon:yes gene_type:complete